jgi:sugar/nucleoside kinase (ribokinase family)
MKTNILVVGSVALDTVETPLGTVEDTTGGSALYFSIAAGLFAPVNVVAVVGNDFDFARIGFVKQKKIDTGGIQVVEGKTFRWGGKYYQNYSRRDTLFTQLNVFENFKPVIPERYRKSEYVFLANIDPQLQLDVLRQIRRPKLVVLDTMNFWITGRPELLRQIIQKSDILILNDEEARQLTGQDQLGKAGQEILRMGPRYLVIKKGEHGALLFGRNLYFATPAFPVDRLVDPTGAGDSFAGGFVGYLAKSGRHDEATLRKAVIYGSIVASFNVEDFSFTRLQKLTRKELAERVKRFRAITRY